MTTAKNKVFIGLSLENYYLVGKMRELTFGGEVEGDKNLVGGGSIGGIFPRGGMSKLSAGGRGLPPSFPVGKPIYIYIYISFCQPMH